MAGDDGATRLELASAAHAGVVAALHAACFDEAWDAQAMAGVLSMPGSVGLIALRDAEPVGCIVCRVAADEAEVLTFAVLPEAQRGGIGATQRGAAGCRRPVSGGGRGQRRGAGAVRRLRLR